MKTALTTILLATAVVANSYAQTYVYESFNMATGDLDGQSSIDSIGLDSNGWVTDGASAHLVVDSPSLNYGGLENSGNYLSAGASSAADDASITIDSAGISANLANDTSLWFSVIIDNNTGSDQHSAFAFGSGVVDGNFDGTEFDTGSGFGIYMGGGYSVAAWDANSSTNPTKAAGNKGGSSITLKPADPSDGPKLFVGKLDWTASGETITVWNLSFDDLAFSSLGTGATITTTNDIDQTAFNTISYTARSTSGSLIFDEIRFGATFDDVTPVLVPEPSSFALIGGCLALTSIMLRRRRD